MSVYFAEFLGTAILVLFGDGVVANVLLARSKGFNGGWIVVAMGWGLAVTLAVYAVGTISGAHINPAVTLGLAVTGQFEMGKVPGYIAAQVAGGFVGGVLVWLAYLPHWRETADPAAKRGIFCTAPAIRHTGGNLLCEIIGTAALLLCGLSIASKDNFTEPGWATGLGPLLAGLTVLAIGLSLGGPTGYAINPARDLGPRLAHAFLPIAGKGDSDWSYAWIPIVGPILGGCLGALAHQYLFR